MQVTRNLIGHLFFDWDGTLLDSSRSGYKAFRKTFKELGVRFDRQVYRATYSPNWYTMYESLGLPEDLWQKADDLWLRHYGEEAPQLVADGRDTLESLEKKGYRFGIVSSGTRSRVLREIGALGLHDSFPVVVCNEDITNRKPHPEGLQKALRAAGAAPKSSAYIGDSPEDIQMGKGAGVLTVGIRSDYPNNQRLALAKPDLYLKSVSQLLQHF